jgi:hypothetical protein
VAAWMYLFRVFLRRFVGEEALFHAFYSFCVGWSCVVGGLVRWGGRGDGDKARGIASPRACFLVEVPTAGVITTDHHRLHFIDFDRTHQFSQYMNA